MLYSFFLFGYSNDVHSTAVLKWTSLISKAGEQHMKSYSLQRLLYKDKVFFPGEFHEQRSLVGYSPWDCNELDMTEATEHKVINKICKNG